MVRPYQQNNFYFNLTEDNYVSSTGYAQLRALGSSIFLYQIVHTHSFVNSVISRCTGTSYPAINSSDLGNIPAKIPSLPEQQKIADFLKSLDQQIDMVREQLAQTQAFKSGLLQRMFV